MKYLIIALVALMSVASAGVIFEEDFESYANGSLLNGQGGWTLKRGSSLRINNAGNLPGNVLDGITFPGSYQQTEHLRNIGSLSNYSQIEMSFDSYGILGSFHNPTTHNTLMGLADTNGTTGISWTYANNPQYNPAHIGRFTFNVGGGTYESFTAHSFYDRDINFSFTLDMTTLDAQGVIKDAQTGQVLYTTAVLTADAATVASLDSVRTYHDFRYTSQGYRGAEYDNVVVSGTAVPEPSSLSLAFLGGFGALMLRRRKAVKA